MFGNDFYPTPKGVIQFMIEGEDLTDKVILEPSAGKGNIVDFLKELPIKDVIACENHPELSTVIHSKCYMVAYDFLSVRPEQISHIDCIIMNPPFSVGVDHVLHAFNVAPPGAKIIALVNTRTTTNLHTTKRLQLLDIIKDHGSRVNLARAFSGSERHTYVDVSLIKLQKPYENYKQEFEGFLFDEEEEKQEIGILSYNAIRDLVNRFIGAIKLFDKQIELAVQLNELTGEFHRSKIAFSCKVDDKSTTRMQYKKELQKSAWLNVFAKMKMEKYVTAKLKADLNNFVEKQSEYPFTMRNVYTMIQTVINTHSKRMDLALEKIFDKLTKSYHENRYNVEGWKTNSHYLINEKFILSYPIEQSFSGKVTIKYSYYDDIDDLMKGLCYITGTNYDEITPAFHFNQEGEIQFGKWSDYGFFSVKCFKKGTMHFKFKNRRVWELFNSRIAKIKGYNLYEAA